MEEKLTLHIVSHTHWDREWYLSFQRYRWRFVKTVDSLLDSLERDSDFRVFMMDGQFLVLKDYLEVFPGNKSRISKLVRSGRLLIGPWYSQPNEYMVSGESMIRNLLLGIRESEAMGGVMKLCYLPDAFGQITQLPQIARGFGMGEACFHRGAPEKSDTVFNWTGADGSQIQVLNTYGGYHLAYDLPIQEDDFVEYIDGQPFPQEGLKKRVSNLIGTLQPFSKCPHLLFMNGVDHSGPQRNISEVIRKINETIPGVYAVNDTLQDYAAAVREYYEENKIEFSQVKGELRHAQGWILEGSQSTRADVKIVSNRIEGKFEKWMEPFASFCWMLGAKYPWEMIWQAWEYLLQNHAHDSLACSSTDATYHQVKVRFEWAEELGDEIIAESLLTLCNRISCNNATQAGTKLLTVFNPLGWERSEIITASIDIPKSAGIVNPVLVDGDTVIPMEIHHHKSMNSLKFNLRVGIPNFIPVDRYLVSFRADHVPALGYKAFVLRSNPVPLIFQGTLVTSHNVMENEFIQVSIQPNGTFNLYDKRTERLYPNQHFFEDSGEAGEGFSRMPPKMDRVVYSVGNHAKISLVENTSLKATFQVDLDMELPEALTTDRQGRSDSLAACSISSRITLAQGALHVDIQTKVVNRAKDHRLRVLFPSMVNDSHSFAESPFDVVQREITLPDLNQYPGEKPASEHPQLTFAGISDGKIGLTIANHGLYEYEVMDNSEHSIAITLLRCLDRIIGGPIYECEDLFIPEAQCLGEYIFNYSVVPHAGTWHEAYRPSYEFRFPMRAVIERELEDESFQNFDRSSITKILPSEESFVSIEPDNMVITAVKKHESRNSIIIRAVNLSEENVKGSIKLDATVKKASEAYFVNLNEEREAAAEFIEEGRVGFTVPGKGILSVEFVCA